VKLRRRDRLDAMMEEVCAWLIILVLVVVFYTAFVHWTDYAKRLAADRALARATHTKAEGSR
jgi:hypothetical protein